MSKSKVGELNTMFNKEKSKEFIAYMSKDRRGSNNPVFRIAKSEETLAKLRKRFMSMIITNSLLNVMIA